MVKFAVELDPNTQIFTINGYTASHKKMQQNREKYWFSRQIIIYFTQPPSGRRRMRICFAVVFLFFVVYFLFFFVFCFFPSTKTMRQPFSGTAKRIFMKLSPNDGGNVVWNVVPPLGESRAAAWRMANVDALRILRYDSFCSHQRAPRNLGYDSGGLTRGRQRLRYTTMSGRIGVI